jgi:hypothetical protein
VRKYLIAAAMAIAVVGMGITPAWATTSHYLYQDTLPTTTGFGAPPATGDGFEPTGNLAAYAAVSEGGGYYEWEADGMCITANASRGIVDSEPCGRYPASQEWNYNNYGGGGTLYNSFTDFCIWGGSPYYTIGPCEAGVSGDEWFTPDS